MTTAIYTKLNEMLSTSAINRVEEDSDFELLPPIKAWSEIDKKNYGYFQEFALGEKIGHHYAYQELKSAELLISLREKDGLTEYKRTSLQSHCGGVVAHLYLPTEEKSPCKVYVSFTGTHSAATLHADLEHCPGEASFQATKGILMTQINEALAHVKGPVELCFAGHSLGGAYAQQALVEAMLYSESQINPASETLTEATTKLHHYLLEQYGIIPSAIPNSAYTHFNKISGLNLYTWNSAGVSHVMDEISTPLSNQLIEQGKKITAYIGMNDGDPVQCTGEGSVLAESQAQVVNLKVFGERNRRSSILQAISGLGFAAAGSLLGPIGTFAGGIVGTFISLAPRLEAHTRHHFKKEETPIDYELVCNASPEGYQRIKNRLRNKSSLLNNSAIQFGRQCLHTTGYFASKTKENIFSYLPSIPWLKVM